MEGTKAFFWTLTACEVALIWSVNHLRSPIAHRILVLIVHPWANFPPNPHVSLSFAVVWSMTLLSLTVHLRFKSNYRRIRCQSSGDATSLDRRQVRDAAGLKRLQTTRRILLGSSPVVAIGSTLCFLLPGSFPYECWVWRMRFGGTVFCFMQVSYLAFWLVMVVWRCVRSRRGGGGGGTVSGGSVEEVVSSESSPEEDTSEDSGEALRVSESLD